MVSVCVCVCVCVMPGGGVRWIAGRKTGVPAAGAAGPPPGPRPAAAAAAKPNIWMGRARVAQ